MASVQTTSRTYLPRTAHQPTDLELVAEARATTRGAARTFSIACRMLPRAVRDDVYLLYLVFRTLDDLVDEGRPEAADRVHGADTFNLPFLFGGTGPNRGSESDPDLRARGNAEVRRHDANHFERHGLRARTDGQQPSDDGGV